MSGSEIVAPERGGITRPDRKPRPRPPLLETPAFAKLNLTLAVGSRRGDGFHDLRSIFLRVGLSDRLVVALRGEIEGDVGPDTLEVRGDPRCPVEDNLVLRAAALLRAGTRGPLPPLAFRLEKAIPVGAGLGGGSSDAAAALELAGRAWALAHAPAEVLELAARLGSDVPFFAMDVPAALVEGRGENVTPLPAVRGRLGVLLVTPPARLSTGAVFAAFDKLGPSGDTAARMTRRLADALSRGMDAPQLVDEAASLRRANDLWPAATQLQPELEGLRDELEDLLERPMLLSGSGPTLFALYPSRVDAANAARALTGRSRPRSMGAFIASTDLTVPDRPWSRR